LMRPYWDDDDDNDDDNDTVSEPFVSLIVYCTVLTYGRKGQKHRLKPPVGIRPGQPSAIYDRGGDGR
jgi:hypothetical protein